MTMVLQRYSFNVIYKRGSSLYIADTLSRSYLSGQTEYKTNDFEVFRLEVVGAYQENHPNFRHDTELKLKSETHKDENMRKLIYVILNGWPQTKQE